MLPRRQRLTRPNFSALTHGKRAVSPHFLVLFAHTASKGGCAVVVPKKAVPLAVDRHLVKRRTLSILRSWCSMNGALVVHVKRGSLALPFPEFRRELEGLLHSLIPTARS